MKWFRESIQGKDGKASSRKLTTFAGMSMFGVTWMCDLFFELTISETMLIIIGIIILVGAGYLTAQNIVDILKRPQSSIYADDVYNPYRKLPDDPSFPPEG